MRIVDCVKGQADKATYSTTVIHQKMAYFWLGISAKDSMYNVDTFAMDFDQLIPRAPLPRAPLAWDDYQPALKDTKDTLHGFDDWRIDELKDLPSFFWDQRSRINGLLESGESILDPNYAAIKSPAMDKPGLPSVSNKRVLFVANFNRKVYMRAMCPIIPALGRKSGHLVA
jgi:hypothetical protein